MDSFFFETINRQFLNEDVVYSGKNQFFKNIHRAMWKIFRLWTGYKSYICKLRKPKDRKHHDQYNLLRTFYLFGENWK